MHAAPPPRRRRRRWSALALTFLGLVLAGFLARRGRARKIDKDERAEGRALDASFAPNGARTSRLSAFDASREARIDDIESPSAPTRVESASATPKSALEAARASGARAGRDVVLVAFANGRVSDATMNWAKHLSRAGSTRMRHVLGALDDVALERARALGVVAYAATHEDLDHGAAHASENWRAFCAMMIGELKTLVDGGYDVVLSDVDVAWTRDAAPYFLCEQAGKADGCEDIRDADVMISSDNLSPTKDWNEGARYARAGIFNTGVVYVRSTPRGKEFITDWWTHLTATSGPYAKLTSHQQVFNRMVRQENAWPGLDVRPGSSERTRVLESGAPLSSGETFALGVLPLRFFANGHGYFVQRVNLIRSSSGDADGAGRGAQPYAVHATYTFDGSGNDAKRYRFQEVGLWLGQDEGEAASDRARYLTFDAPTVRTTKEEADIGDHIAVARANVRALRKAFAYAAALNRTLAIPRLACRCDKVWGGHDNVFKAKCHYPGAEGEEYLPGVCPLDHFVSPSAIRRAGGVFVPAASAPPAATADAVLIDWSTSQTDDFSPTYRARERFLTLGAVDDAPELARDASAAAARVDAVLTRPERWCAECVPDRACTAWMSHDVLGLGSTSSTRGGASESWCADLA